MYVQCLTASSAMRQRFSAATAAALLKGWNSIALGSRDGSSLIRYSWSQEGSKGNRCWTAWLRSASWIRITSPSLTFISLDLCFMFSLSLRDFRYYTPHSTDSIKPLYTSIDTSLSSSSQHPFILCFLLGQGSVDQTSWHMESKLVAEHRLPDMTEGDYSPPILHPARLPQAHST